MKNDISFAERKIKLFRLDFDENLADFFEISVDNVRIWGKVRTIFKNFRNFRQKSGKKLELVQIFIFSFHFSIRVLGAHRRGGPGLPLRCCGEEDEGQESGVAVRRGEGRLSCGWRRIPHSTQQGQWCGFRSTGFTYAKYLRVDDPSVILWLNAGWVSKSAVHTKFYPFSVLLFDSFSVHLSQHKRRTIVNSMNSLSSPRNKNRFDSGDWSHSIATSGFNTFIFSILQRPPKWRNPTFPGFPFGWQSGGPPCTPTLTSEWGPAMPRSSDLTSWQGTLSACETVACETVD